jgi:MFS family permease
MTAAAFDLGSDPNVARRRDWKIISLIGAAHSCSHFFQLVIPTLYLSLAMEFGYDFAQLGGLVSAFFLVSSLGQASSGFVVDRVGPAPVLRFGLACFVVAGALIGLATGYSMLLLGAIIGGIGNSIFHPVDYSIINHRISPARLGHAFSVHGLTGSLGWALTPVFMAGLIHLWDWRTASFGAAGLIAFVLVLTWFGRALLTGENSQQYGGAATDRAATGSVVPAAGAPSDAMAPAAPAPVPSAPATKNGDLSTQSIGQTLATLLVQPALWGAFLFFACTSMALSAVQNYTIPMLGDVYGIDKILAGSVLSAYMLCAALGMLAGGFLVGATPKTERTVAVSLVFSGLLLVVLATGAVTPVIAMALVGLAGFCSGVSAPSRDMLIRRVTPKGAIGTVYGLVYSGMDVGASLAPVGFGLMLDFGFQQGPWLGAGVSFAAAALLALWVGRSASAAAPRLASA